MIIKRLIIFFFLISASLTYDLNASDYKKVGAEKTIINSEKKELSVGEEGIYRVELFGIPIGWINLKVKEKTLFNNHLCYHITAQAYTNQFFKKFYDVEYNVGTYVDVETFLPYRFQKERKLKGELTQTKIDFDWIKRQAVISNNTSTQIVNLNERYQDLLSSIYYFRLMDIEAKRDYTINIFYGQTPWQINIKVKSLQNMDIYRKGTFDIFETEITTDLSQVILGSPRITVYFLNDKTRAPLIFSLRIPFGHLKGKIYNLKN